MAKPFHDSYKVLGEDGTLVLINGEQITKIVARQLDKEWQLTFHLSDGSTYGITNSEWNKSFVAENFAPMTKLEELV